jgi:hypothetical protein
MPERTLPACASDVKERGNNQCGCLRQQHLHAADPAGERLQLQGFAAFEAAAYCAAVSAAKRKAQRLQRSMRRRQLAALQEVLAAQQDLPGSPHPPAAPVHNPLHHHGNSPVASTATPASTNSTSRGSCAQLFRGMAAGHSRGLWSPGGHPGGYQV